MTDIEPIKDGEIIEYLSEQNKALTDDVIRLSKEANELRESKIRLINSLKRMQSDLSDLSDMARKISGDINVYRRAISHLIELASEQRP